MQALVIRGLLPAIALTLCFGCGEPQSESQSEEPDAAGAATETAAEIQNEVAARLAAADQADGEADQVVSLCLGCGLAMDGSEEHALHVSDYSVHFCSESCKDGFSEDPEGAILALALPDLEE